MRLEKFDAELKRVTEEIGSFYPFTGNIQDVIVAEDLFERTSVEFLLSEVSEGKTFKTAHIATKEQLVELGIEQLKGEFFIFESPTNFTKPVIIPE